MIYAVSVRLLKYVREWCDFGVESGVAISADEYMHMVHLLSLFSLSLSVYVHTCIYIYISHIDIVLYIYIYDI